MKTSTAKFECLQLLQLLLLCGRCESLAGSSLSDVFFPFGSDEGDSVVPVGDDNCEGPINLPYKIFNKTTLYVSWTARLAKPASSFGGVVDWNNSCRYLGVYFASGRIFTCCFDYAKSRLSAHLRLRFGFGWLLCAFTNYIYLLTYLYSVR